MNYQLIKAFHLIFVVSWFAGMFYIFRLFVYHLENWDDLKICELFLKMEKRLLSYIMTPALVLSAFFGMWMLYENPNLLRQTWMQVKLVSVLFLIFYHGYSYFIFTQLKQRKKIIGSKTCRIINEVPTLFLIIICILAFLKPMFT